MNPDQPEMPRTLAFQGFSLALPADWNLTHHASQAQRGVVHLSDLFKTQLEVRWRSASGLRQHLARFGSLFEGRDGFARLCDHLQKRHARHFTFVELGEDHVGGIRNAVRMDLESAILLLFQAAERTYELTFPPGCLHVDAILNSFKDHSCFDLWPWQLYGVSGRVSRRFRLRKAILMPGQTELDFILGRRQISLGSWALADQILREKSLREWAVSRVPFARSYPRGNWTEEPDAASLEIRHRNILGRPVTRSLHLHLSRVDNTIHWERSCL